MKALHLKALCKERGLKVSGKKSDFIERLREHFTSAATKGNFDAQQSSPSQRLQAAEVLEMFDSMTGAELKTVCRERGLKLSGKKSELLDRLLEYSNSGDGHLDSQPTRDDLDSMSVADLGHALIARGITDFGTREELLERLRQDIKMTKELHEAAPPTGRVEYNDLSRVMEEASKQGVVIAEHLAEMKVKSTVVPKFVDVTITSLGLKPEKYTDGGSPSVTADVLRKLAGDPFADPPKYGTVSSHESAVLVN